MNVCATNEGGGGGGLWRVKCDPTAEFAVFSKYCFVFVFFIKVVIFSVLSSFQDGVLSLKQFDKRTPGKFKPEFIGYGQLWK